MQHQEKSPQDLPDNVLKAALDVDVDAEALAQRTLKRIEDNDRRDVVRPSISLVASVALVAAFALGFWMPLPTSDRDNELFQLALGGTSSIEGTEFLTGWPNRGEQ